MIDFKSCCPYLTLQDIEEIESLPLTPYKGGVYNKRRISFDELVEKFDVKANPFDDASFIFDNELSKSVEHFSGGFYIMDPSATLVSAFLEGKDQELIIDLCAAPGGKTISYALKYPNSIIIANEINKSRLRDLAFNIERMGLSNVIITSLEVSYLAKRFPRFFDRVILDAPCSGSGMFRKDRKVAEDWSKEKVTRLAELQKELIDKAKDLVKDGGYLSYSTCSFSPEEDDDVIIDFLEKNKDFSSKSLSKDPRLVRANHAESIHLLPTKFSGEGHFISVLKRSGVLEGNTWFKKDQFGFQEYKDGERRYLVDAIPPFLSDLKPFRVGIMVSSPFDKSPYTLAYGRMIDEYDDILRLDSEEEAMNYLRGYELKTDIFITKLFLVRYNKLNLGWGKNVSGRLKNFLPKGHRIMNF